MIATFDGTEGSIQVKAKFWRSTYLGYLMLVLDTGAEVTVINSRLLKSMGFMKAELGERIKLQTANGSQIAEKVIVPKISALGKTRKNFEVVCYELPKTIGCDGLLGLDFFRGFDLNINFKTGQIHLK